MKLERREGDREHGKKREMESGERLEGRVGESERRRE